MNAAAEILDVPDVARNVVGAQRTALVVGGTDGIGKEVARGLVRSGLDVIIVGRDAQKGARAKTELEMGAHRPCVQLICADLAEMAEVSRLAEHVRQRTSSLEVVVLCAGIVSGRFVLTRDGVEENFAVNFLSRYVLLRRLRELLEASAIQSDVRIILVSGANQGGKVHFDDVNRAKQFSTVGAISQYCAANDTFAIEFTRRLAQSDKTARIAINCMKFGPVKTNIRRHFPLWMKMAVPLLDPFITITAEEAARSVLLLALDAKFAGVSGQLFTRMRRFERVMPDAFAADRGNGAALWALCEKLAANQLDGSMRKNSNEAVS